MSRQYIEGAGFSLERSTENVPEDGRYYLLRDGVIAAVFDNQDEAQLEYHQLCLSYWNQMLGSSDLDTRVKAARALLRRDRKNMSALSILASYGDTKEKNYASESIKRMERQQLAVVS
ncbi:MAG TPA: hypothetical protein VHR86_07710 [Armatimonadota bacterium]|nr:hypothetical protein [Armatimonadota bacterium]